jgi:ribonuclease PH
VALAIALNTLVAYKALAKSPLVDSVAATSVGMVNGVAMLDLAYEEDSRADVDMNVVMTGKDKFVEVQATAEQEAFDDAEMAELIALARIGLTHLRELQQAALHAKK